jgi:hypothetical protein
MIVCLYVGFAVLAMGSKGVDVIVQWLLTQV